MSLYKMQILKDELAFQITREGKDAEVVFKKLINELFQKVFELASEGERALTLTNKTLIAQGTMLKNLELEQQELNARVTGGLLAAEQAFKIQTEDIRVIKNKLVQGGL